uniref:chaperone protein dnaJ 20, chloroplastic-like n=1 Tax=Erigeron canadensis TaxID=72917 RepID=UPI001CB9A567|nr:chaperone protein dnaJ 20, chloroplastic-like [Erigeron canadensis]
MNSKSFPSTAQSLLTPSNKQQLISSPLHYPHLSFPFNKTHSNYNKNNISIYTNTNIRTYRISTKASATTANSNVCIESLPQNETLYDLLGITESGTLSDIKQAYKKMALKYHPDVSPPDRAEEYTVKFIRVQEAYETLSDPEARFMYDNSMKGLHMAFSGKKRTRFGPRSEDKKAWKETWSEQISELTRRSKVNPERGMSWAARIRKQRNASSSVYNGSG